MIWKSFGSESKGVSFRNEVPAVWIHVYEALVDQLHSLGSVVEDARSSLPVEAVGDQLERSVVRLGLVDSDLFFSVLPVCFFKKKYNISNIIK